MSTTVNAIRKIDFFRLMRATEGLTQRRPFIAGFVTILGAILVGFFSAYLARSVDSGTFEAILYLLGAVGVFVVLASGFSAVGVLLMDQAKSIPQRSMQDAFVFSFMCLPRFIGFGLLMLALAVVISLVAALVYFICKIPGVGPLLFFIAHPFLVVASGLIFAIVVWVGIPLIAPSIWEGRSLKEALSVLIAAAKERLLIVVLSFLALYLVVGVVASLVSIVLISGYFSMSGLAIGILGSDVLSGGVSSLMSMFMPSFGDGYDYGGYSGGSGSGYLYAGLAASFLIFSVAGALLAQVLIMGLNLVYLTVTEGLDVAASQAEMEKKLAELKQKAQEAQERARQAAERARQAAQQEPKPAPAMSPQSAAPSAAVSATPTMANVGASPQTPASACPNCKAPIATDDLFCGECGHRLMP